jgi:hypothetical protein
MSSGWNRHTQLAFDVGSLGNHTDFPFAEAEFAGLVHTPQQADGSGLALVEDQRSRIAGQPEYSVRTDTWGGVRSSTKISACSMSQAFIPPAAHWMVQSCVPVSVLGAPPAVMGFGA